MLSYSGNVDGIRQVVVVKKMLGRWLSLSRSRKEASRKPNSKPPPGCVFVYVGDERRRFAVPTSYLNLPVFSALLRQSEEEFGYRNAGALVLPCDATLFAGLLRALAKKDKAFAGLTLDGAFRLLSEDSLSRCKQSNALLPSPSVRTPLLQKSKA